MSDLFSALDRFTSHFSEDINTQGKIMIISLFAFLNAFTREEDRYRHMTVINDFCIKILLRQIKNVQLHISTASRDLLFQIQYHISLKLDEQNKILQQNNDQFKNPFGFTFIIFRRNVNSLIDLIQFLKLSNCVDIEIDYDSLMLSDTIKNSFATLLQDTRNVCNSEGVRAQIAMPNVLQILEAM